MVYERTLPSHMVQRCSSHEYCVARDALGTQNFSMFNTTTSHSKHNILAACIASNSVLTHSLATSFSASHASAYQCTRPSGPTPGTRASCTIRSRASRGNPFASANELSGLRGVAVKRCSHCGQGRTNTNVMSSAYGCATRRRRILRVEGVNIVLAHMHRVRTDGQAVRADFSGRYVRRGTWRFDLGPR